MRKMNSVTLRNETLWFFLVLFLNLTDGGTTVRQPPLILDAKQSWYKNVSKLFSYTPSCHSKHRARFPFILISQIPRVAKMEQQSHLYPTNENQYPTDVRCLSTSIASIYFYILWEEKSVSLLSSLETNSYMKTTFSKCWKD